MPTSYTQPIYDGEPITFEQFMLRCSRGMGAAIMQRDESLDVEIQMREVDAYRIQAVENAGAILAEAWSRTDEEWARLHQEDADATREAHERLVERDEALRARYTAMSERVRAWIPPTKDHLEFKRFVQQQLLDSMEFDTGHAPTEPPAEIPLGEYRERQIHRLAKDLEYATAELQKERERVRTQNAWVAALRLSLLEVVS